jgi:quinol monooxygenase YgiN
MEMKTAFNIVKFRVKPGKETAFEEAHREAAKRAMPGGRSFHLVRTADREYCFIGEWDDFDSIVAARPVMIAELDRLRPLLEDLGNGLGVTDPASGEAVVTWKAARHEVMQG